MFQYNFCHVTLYYVVGINIVLGIKCAATFYIEYGSHLYQYSSISIFYGNKTSLPIDEQKENSKKNGRQLQFVVFYLGHALQQVDITPSWHIIIDLLT